jgi:hypothetical protein
MIALGATSCCNCDKECPQKDKCEKSEMMEHHGPKHHKGHHDGKNRHHDGRKGGADFHGPKKECNWSPEQKEMFEKWMKFDSLSTDEQKALLKERKAMIDKREADWAAKKAEMEQKKAEMEQKWANFDNLSIEEQKQLIEWKSFCPKKGKFGHPDKCRGPKKDCFKECPTEE